MTLQKKTVLVFLLLGAVLAAGSYVALKLVVLPAFETFERESAAEDVSRVQHAISADLTALDILSREYSEWDHTYDYARGLRDEFVEENLDTSYWNNIEINMMLFFDIDGEMLWGAIVDKSTNNQLPLEHELLQTITPEHPLLQRGEDLEGTRGWLQARSAPMLVSANPILTSVAKGPPVGTLIIGKYVDAATVATFGERAAVDLALYDRNNPGDLERITEVQKTFSQTGAKAMREITDDRFISLKFIDNVFGEPAFLLEVISSRRISEIGQGIVENTFIYLIIVSAFFLVAAWVIVRTTIVMPIARVTSHMLDIRQSGDLEKRFNYARSDEIGLLANELDKLAADLGRAQSELEAARDEALAVSKAKGEFLARMSHEIRTPMNGVLGMIELLSSTPLEDTQKRYAQTIHQSADSLLDVINDILDFSKIESGRLQLESVDFDLNSFLDDFLGSLENLAHQKGLSLECVKPEGPALSVRGDPFRLRQVLTNLIGNAIKFTEKGGVTLRVIVADADADSRHLRFEVSDTGIGISKTKQKIIFDSFAQEDGSTTRRFGGTGLGLAISKQLVDMMGGEICVCSEPGMGSTFSFTLKMRANNLSALTESARSIQHGFIVRDEGHPEIGRLHGRVLLCEDNAVNQEVAVGMMTAMRLETVVARNGAEAIELFSTNDFDLVLMDCQMPVVDGYQATQSIRRIEAEKELRPTPVVAVTANVMAGDREKCLAAGMNDFLSKPFTGDELYKVLSKNLATRTSSEAQESNAVASARDEQRSRISASAIDHNVLDDLAKLSQSGDQDLARRVIHAYLGCSDELMRRLGDAISSGNHDDVRSKAHALKSSSGNVGALELSEICRLLEAAAIEGSLEGIKEFWQRLREEHGRVIVALKLRIEEAAA
jgi:signal transduction histidine kinase/DNA-binding response OmpR family regulator